MAKSGAHSRSVTEMSDTSRSFFTRTARLEPPADGLTGSVVFQDIVKGATALDADGLVRHRGLRHGVGDAFELFDITGGVGDGLLHNRVGARVALDKKTAHGTLARSELVGLGILLPLGPTVGTHDMTTGCNEAFLAPFFGGREAGHADVFVADGTGALDGTITGFSSAKAVLAEDGPEVLLDRSFGIFRLSGRIVSGGTGVGRTDSVIPAVVVVTTGPKKRHG